MSIRRSLLVSALTFKLKRFPFAFPVNLRLFYAQDLPGRSFLAWAGSNQLVTAA